MSHFVYILYSQKLDKYYIGESKDVLDRLKKHNADNNQSFTSKGIPWELKTHFAVPDSSYALKVEKHIKSQKSRKFVKELVERGSLREFPQLTKIDS